MKTIKHIPILTRSLILLSIIFYLLNCYYGNINDFFGMYQLSNENFNIFQILTFSFCHEINPSHLLNNIAFFILVSSQLEKKIGYNILFLILLTILINVIGINLVSIESNVIGLSSVLFSMITFFILTKNNLDHTLNFGLKFVLLLFVLDNLIAIVFGLMNNDFNINFYSTYLHFLGIISGLVFYLYIKIKKLIKR